MKGNMPGPLPGYTPPHSYRQTPARALAHVSKQNPARAAASLYGHLGQDLGAESLRWNAGPVVQVPWGHEAKQGLQSCQRLPCHCVHLQPSLHILQPRRCPSSAVQVKMVRVCFLSFEVIKRPGTDKHSPALPQTQCPSCWPCFGDKGHARPLPQAIRQFYVSYGDRIVIYDDSDESYHRVVRERRMANGVSVLSIAPIRPNHTALGTCRGTVILMNIITGALETELKVHPKARAHDAYVHGSMPGRAVQRMSAEFSDEEDVMRTLFGQKAVKVRCCPRACGVTHAGTACVRVSRSASSPGMAVQTPDDRWWRVGRSLCLTDGKCQLQWYL